MKHIVAIVTLLLFTSLAFAQIGTTIDHTPIATAVAGQSISVQVKALTSPNDITKAIVAYRKPGEASYHEGDLLPAGNGFSGEIPGSYVTEKGIEYYIAVESKNGTRETLPPSSAGAPSSPFSVTVRSAGSAPAGTVIFQLVTPDPTEPQDAAEDVIVSIAVLGGELDLATARLEIDDAAVTSKANVSPELVSYIAKGLTAGAHKIRMSGYTKTGLAIASLEEKFHSVRTGDLETARTPFTFEGNGWSETRLERVGNATGGTDKHWWQREGLNFSGRYGNTNFGGRFYLTNEERTYEQPRNRYQFWFSGKWYKIGLGDNNPDYTPLTISGTRVRGLLAELHGGPFHIEFANGKTAKQVDDNRDDADVSYARELTSVRNWYGSKIGSNFGLTLVKVRDNRFGLDSTVASQNGITPQENLVIGSDIQFAFDSRRILINGEFAGSLYNRDIRGGSVNKDSLEKLMDIKAPFDPKKYEKYFVLNANMIPLDPSKKTNLAYTYGLQLNYFNNNFQFKFRNTGPAFYSLAASSIIPDDAGISIRDRMHLLQNRLYVTVGYESAHNNLNNNSVTGTVKQGITNFDISYYPPESYLPDVSLSYRGGTRKNDIDTAVVVDNRVNEKLTNMSIFIAKSFRMANYDHSASFSINNFKRADQYSRTAGSPFNSSTSMFNLSWKTKWQTDLSTTIDYSNMKVESPVMVGSLYTGKSSTFGSIGLRGDKTWLRNKLSTFLAFTSQTASGLSPYSKTNFSLGGGYLFPYQLSARLQADFLSTKYSDVTSNGYTTKGSTVGETFAWLRLEKTF